MAKALPTPDGILSRTDALALLPEVRRGNQTAARAFAKSASYHYMIGMGLTPERALAEVAHLNDVEFVVREVNRGSN